MYWKVAEVSTYYIKYVEFLCSSRIGEVWLYPRFESGAGPVRPYGM